MEILRSFSTRSIRIAIDVMEEDLKMLLNFALQTFLTKKILLLSQFLPHELNKGVSIEQISHYCL